MIHPKWDRWIIASVNKHFADRIMGVHIHYEGAVRETESLDQWLELRIDGPDYHWYSKKRIQGVVEINVGIVVVEGVTNIYNIHDLSGLVHNCFTPEIPVFKYGEVGNPHLGCLQLKNSAGEGYNIRKYFFGRVNAETPMYQAAVEAPYRIDLET